MQCDPGPSSIFPRGRARPVTLVVLAEGNGETSSSNGRRGGTVGVIGVCRTLAWGSGVTNGRGVGRLGRRAGLGQLSKVGAKVEASVPTPNATVRVPAGPSVSLGGESVRPNAAGPGRGAAILRKQLLHPGVSNEANAVCGGPSRVEKVLVVAGGWKRTCHPHNSKSNKGGGLRAHPALQE